MPILPLDSPEPFAATLGVMLYPGTDKSDQAKARAFAARWLAEPLRRFHASGRQLPYDALRWIAEGGGEALSELEARRQGGTATGELFKAFYILAETRPRFASWENAIKIYQRSAAGPASGPSRSLLHQYLHRFRPVAHLWGAWSMREGRFEERPSVGYEGYEDFQSFLQEAEILRDFGQVWRPARRKARPVLPDDVWKAPRGWRPLQRQAGWPQTGVIPHFQLPEKLLATLRSAGRPAAQP
jgi:hypothetical protein